MAALTVPQLSLLQSITAQVDLISIILEESVRRLTGAASAESAAAAELTVGLPALEAALAAVVEET